MSLKNYDAIEKNGYTVINQIGKGAYGYVFKVKSNKSEDIDNIYALKFILYGTASRKKNAFREIECGKTFNHPNILKFYGSFSDDEQQNEANCAFQVLELCKINLSDWIKSDDGINRTDDKCAKMFRDIALGLEYIHGMGFIHRDLKPENILITFDGICKISDFGLSILFDQIQQSNTRGNLIYASPEQLQNKPYDVKADIFPMGCIFMELYTELSDYYEVFIAINGLRNSQLPSNFFSKFKANDIERYENAKELVMKMTKIEPNDRPLISEIIKDSFFNNHQL